MHSSEIDQRDYSFDVTNQSMILIMHQLNKQGASHCSVNLSVSHFDRCSLSRLGALFKPESSSHCSQLCEITRYPKDI